MNIKQSNKFGLATFPSLFFIGIFNKSKKIILFYAICLEHMRSENIMAFAGCFTKKFLLLESFIILRMFSTYVTKLKTHNPHIVIEFFLLESILELS